MGAGCSRARSYLSTLETYTKILLCNLLLAVQSSLEYPIRLIFTTKAGRAALLGARLTHSSSTRLRSGSREAAELQIAGTVSEDLYISLLRGSLVALPTPQAPEHVLVLKRLKYWQQSELIPEQLCGQLVAQILSSSRRLDATAGASSTAAPAALEPPAALVAPPAKKQKMATVQKTTLFSVLPGASKTLVKASELRAQRQAALRDEDYALEALDMRCFPSERQQAAPAVVFEFSCNKCARTFSSRLGLENHVLWHSEATKPKEFFTPKPEVIHDKATICLGVDADGLATVSFLIGSVSIEEIEADEAASRAAQRERERMRRNESERRVQLREDEAEADQGEHRRGSKHRRSYTVKEKLRILGVFDSILEDPMVLHKVATFEADPRAKGTPYTTVKVGWAPPLERARISAAAGREHASTLLRIDKTSRKKGKFAEMEAELFSRFKARRARGRKVSGRWLTAMGR